MSACPFGQSTHTCCAGIFRGCPHTTNPTSRWKTEICSCLWKTGELLLSPLKLLYRGCFRKPNPSSSPPPCLPHSDIQVNWTQNHHHLSLYFPTLQHAVGEQHVGKPPHSDQYYLRRHLSRCSPTFNSMRHRASLKDVLCHSQVFLENFPTQENRNFEFSFPNVQWSWGPHCTSCYDPFRSLKGWFGQQDRSFSAHQRGSSGKYPCI